MIKAKAIRIERGKNNKILGYLLQDSNGNTKAVKSQELKSAIKAGKIEVVNLTLTKDNRLVHINDKVQNKTTNKVKKSNSRVGNSKKSQNVGGASANNKVKATSNMKIGATSSSDASKGCNSASKAVFATASPVLAPASPVLAPASQVFLVPASPASAEEKPPISMGSKKRFNIKNLSAEEILAKINESEENNGLRIHASHYDGRDRVTLYGVDTKKANDNEIDTIYIPYGVTDIASIRGEFQFVECLTRVVIPDTVRRLAPECFMDCVNLLEVELPNSIEEIGDYCFAGCKSLEKIVIPDSIKYISDNCFGGCKSLWDVKIPNSVTKIGDYCFYNCTTLNCIDIPDSVTEIGNGCFYGCTDLVDVGMPSSLTSIGAYCFDDCALCDIYIPDSVEEIGSDCFSGWDCGPICLEIHCNKGSYAEKYCIKHGLQDVLIVHE